MLLERELLGLEAFGLPFELSGLGRAAANVGEANSAASARAQTLESADFTV